MMHNIFSHNYLRRMAFFGLVLLIIAGGMRLSANEAKAAAGVSKILSYQGRLTDQNGAALTGTYYICFSIYDASSAGTKLWPTGVPTNNSVTVTDGVFSAGIGVSDTLGFDFSSNNTVYLNIGVWSANVACDNASVENLAPRQRIDATAYARVAENVFGGEVRVGTGSANLGSQKFLKLDQVTNTAESVGATCSGSNGFMWYNTQTASTGRALICANNVIQVAGGAMTNQFFEVAGPASAIKTFTFPDANTKILGVPIAATIAVGDLFYAGTAGSGSLANLADIAVGSYLRSGGVGAAPVWSTVTLPNTVATGDLLYANATNVLSALAKGTANQVLSMDGTATNVVWATLSGGGSPGGADTQIQFNDATAFGGDADFTWDKTNNTFTLGGADTEIQIKAITNEPTPPASGNILLYAKSIAGRVMPKWVGPAGVDSAMQALIATNKVAWWNPPGNAATVPGVVGFTALTAVGTATARNVATTNMFTRTRRLGYVSVATAGGLSSQRVAVAQYTLGTGAGLGGFTLVVRFGTSDAATVSTARQFVGMSSATAAPTNVEPSTLTNSIGIGHGAADANLKLFYGGSAAQTPIDLGVSFPKNTLSTDMYELILFASPNSNNTVGYRVLRLNTGNIAEGTFTAATPGTQLPASTTLLAYRSWRTNNTQALAVGLDLASIYIETDY